MSDKKHEGKAVVGFAPAKINLTLHVTGRHPTGYHLLDSLVGFVDVGDTLSLSLQKSHNAPRLVTSGRYAQELPAPSENIILRALDALDTLDIQRPLTVFLEKNLPISSGLGGGSSDAATALKLAKGLLGCALPSTDRLMEIGADIPACLQASTLRMQGRGERITPLPPDELPEMWGVLVNAGVSVSTAKIFAQLEKYQNPPMAPHLPKFSRAADFASWVGLQRNDLEKVAISYAPPIQESLKALRKTKGCLVARMSGSGASCFGLYERKSEAEEATQTITKSAPHWWVQPCQFVRATI